MPPLQCQSCGAPVTLGEPIGRDAECDSCGRDLRCCLNCRHYAPGYNNSCRESMAEPVEDKARRNFCEYFSFTRAPFGAAGGSPARQEEARSKLESLFRPRGGTSAQAPEGERAQAPEGSAKAREELDALFRKPTAREQRGDRSSNE